MKVRNEDMGREWAIAEFALQLLAKNSKSCSAIKDVNLLAETDFDAGSIASIAHVLGLWGWRGTAHAPELYEHRFVGKRGPDCLVCSLVSSDDELYPSIAGLVHSYIPLVQGANSRERHLSRHPTRAFPSRL
jgi:hypothetical protein